MEDVTTQKMSFMPVCPPVKEELPWAKRVAILSDSPIEKATTYKLSFIPNAKPQKPKPLRTEDNKTIVTAANEFDDHTVYKESFYGTTECTKRSPILPTPILKNSDAKMNGDTVTHLSFPGHRNVPKASPIWPHARFLLGSGPFNDLTIQKRDFVGKPHSRRSPIIPDSNIKKIDAPIENQTTMQLSYMEPIPGSRSTPIRPKDGVVPANGNSVD